jgi:hypothetical protein
MRTAHILAVAGAMTVCALLSLPAGAAEVCDRNCVGPLCGENCTRTPDVPVGKTVGASACARTGCGNQERTPPRR